MGLKQCISGFKYGVILGIYVKLHGGMGKRFLNTLGAVASRGINFSHQKIVPGFEQRTWWKFKVMRFQQLQQLLKFEWMIYPKISKTFENHFRVSAPSRIATWVDIPFLKAMQAPHPHKGEWESKASTLKRQITDWFRIFAARGPFQADSSSVHLCCDWAFLIVFVVLFWCWQHELLHAPGASGCKLLYSFILFWVHLWNDPPVCKYFINCVGWCGQIMRICCFTCIVLKSTGMILLMVLKFGEHLLICRVFEHLPLLQGLIHLNLCMMSSIIPSTVWLGVTGCE